MGIVSVRALRFGCQCVAGSHGSREKLLCCLAWCHPPPPPPPPITYNECSVACTGLTGAALKCRCCAWWGSRHTSGILAWAPLISQATRHPTRTRANHHAIPACPISEQAWARWLVAVTCSDLLCCGDHVHMSATGCAAGNVLVCVFGGGECACSCSQANVQKRSPLPDIATLSCQNSSART